jgi:hypothetical protein
MAGDQDDSEPRSREPGEMSGRARRLPRLPRLTSPPEGRRLSEILAEVAADDRERVTLGDLLAEMHGRAFGALMLVFAFPNILPSPPGLAGILGLPLVFLSAQLMLGRPPWLPRFIADRSLSRAAFAGLVTRITPWLGRAERMLRERIWVLVSPAAQRVLGAVCLFLSLVLILPVPFGNMLPSIAICLLGLGMLERDGVWIIAGLIAGAVATAVVGAIAYALVKSAIFVLIGAF